ncbi:DsbE family thiol:disulfide interchange protein [Qipengyuania sp. JC766]|uniref:DsbE family thiol:disulfide interchange protein n=1 Tax=Qipengyuania sp. JC766 TaxID=3232139 RepID=UPI0034599DD5
MSRLKLWLPLAAFAFFVGLAAYMLFTPRDTAVASALVGKQVPDFELPAASSARPGVSIADLTNGQPKLLNIWASWCVPCIAEAPQLETLESAGIPIVGVAIRDSGEDVDRFLDTHGNPYTRIGADDISQVQLSIGSSGVPETFVVDGSGTITYQHIGDIRPEHVPLLIEEWRKAGGR